MATTDYHFEPGNDLSAFGVYASALLQLIKLATPNDYHGGLIFDESTPAVTGEPTGYPTDWWAWHKRCVWVKPSTGAMYVYKTGVGWISIFDAIPANTITTAMLQSASVTLAKLSVSGSSPLNLIRVNAAGTGFEFVSPNSIVTSLPIANLAGGASAHFQVLTSTSGANAWQDFDSALLLTLFDNNQIPLNYLAWGGANQVVSMNSAGTALEWANVISKITDGTLTIAKLSPGTGNALKVLRVNASGNALEFATLATPTAPNIETKTDEITTLPAAGSSTNKAHTLGGLPNAVNGKMVNVTAEAGYAPYEVVDLTALHSDDGTSNFDYANPFSFSHDATNVTLTCKSDATDMRVSHKTTGASTTFTPANWKFRFTAVRYY